MKKKRFLIVVYWLAFLMLMGALLFLYEYHTNKKRAVDNLVYQSNSVIEELPQIVKNDVYSQVDFTMMRYARLDSFLLALENVQTMNRANYIANQFYEVADIKGLAFYNENGKVISVIGDYTTRDLDKDSIELFTEAYQELSYDYEIVDENMDDYMEYMFSSYTLSDSTDTNFMIKKSGPWGRRTISHWMN